MNEIQKQSSPKASTLASRVLHGHRPNRTEILLLAASVLSQDEKRGQAKARRRKQRKAA